MLIEYVCTKPSSSTYPEECSDVGRQTLKRDGSWKNPWQHSLSFRKSYAKALRITHANISLFDNLSKMLYPERCEKKNCKSNKSLMSIWYAVLNRKSTITKTKTRVVNIGYSGSSWDGKSRETKVSQKSLMNSKIDIEQWTWDSGTRGEESEDV